MQSGHTQLPARSKPPRRFGKSMHQHRDLPGGAPQLKLVPHSSHTSLSMSHLITSWLYKPVQWNGQSQTTFNWRLAISTPTQMANPSFVMKISPASAKTDGKNLMTENFSQFFGQFLLRLVRCWVISLMPLSPAGFSKTPQMALLRAWWNGRHNGLKIRGP